MFLAIKRGAGTQLRQVGKNWGINKEEISEPKNGGEPSHLSPPLASLPLHKAAGASPGPPAPPRPDGVLYLNYGPLLKSIREPAGGDRAVARIENAHF